MEDVRECEWEWKWEWECERDDPGFRNQELVKECTNGNVGIGVRMGGA